jgi:SAM-dependent methyltransferase
LGLLAAHLGWSPSGRILDLGAGPAHISLPLARVVGEVVVMDPEEGMLEEGRRRAAAAAVDNVSFVAGGSDDLSASPNALGELAGVVISQAFHWMADQDAVLRALDPLVDRKRGAVALVGYVKEPDYNRLWLDRSPWDAVEAILRRHLLDIPPGPSPAGRHDPFPEILSRSPFSHVELLMYEHDVTVEPSIDAAIGTHYSFGNVVARLGRRRPVFEAEVRAELADADTSPVTLRVVDSALIGRRL